LRATKGVGSLLLDHGIGSAKQGKITRSDFYISTFLSVDCCRWREYDYEELIHRDKASLDIFWLSDESLEESDNLLPDPDVLAQEIVGIRSRPRTIPRNRHGLGATRIRGLIRITGGRDFCG
jgi:hypothetical protein